MKAGFALVFGLSASMLLLSVAAPLLDASGRHAYSHGIRELMAGSCHQLPSRSIYLSGYPMAVCARCFGIYLGLAVAALAYPLLSKRGIGIPVWVAPVAAIPIALDGVSQLIGLRESFNALRLLTGFVFAAPLPLYLIEPIDQAWERFFRLMRK